MVTTTWGQRAGKTRISPVSVSNLRTPPTRAFRLPKEVGLLKIKHYRLKNKHWFFDLQTYTTWLSCASASQNFESTTELYFPVHSPICVDIVPLVKETQICLVRLREPDNFLSSGNSIKSCRAGEVDMPWRHTLVTGDQQIVGCSRREVRWFYVQTLICEMISCILSHKVRYSEKLNSSNEIEGNSLRTRIPFLKIPFFH